MEKVVVGEVTIRKYQAYNTMRGYMSKSLKKALKSDSMVFNVKKFSLTLPHIDSKKTTSIKAGYFSFCSIEEDFEKLVGKYRVFQEDEDTYVLKKIKVL